MNFAVSLGDSTRLPWINYLDYWPSYVGSGAHCCYFDFVPLAVELLDIRWRNDTITRKSRKNLERGWNQNVQFESAKYVGLQKVRVDDKFWRSSWIPCARANKREMFRNARKACATVRHSKICHIIVMPVVGSAEVHSKMRTKTYESCWSTLSTGSPLGVREGTFVARDPPSSLWSCWSRFT